MRQSAFLAFAPLLALGACGDDPPPVKQVPTPETVRNLYGLGDGSCWKYRFSQGMTSLYATVTASGPNTTAIAGHTVYERKFALESGGLPTQDYFEVNDVGEIHLLRHVEGQSNDRTTRRYDADPTPPLFARFRLDRAMGGSMNDSDKFETTPTPTITVGMMPATMMAERHVWTVVSSNDTSSTPDGDKTGYKLNYVRNQDGTAIHHLVPGFGLAKIEDFGGKIYQVCAYRVCDATGACTGAASCMPGDLVCN